jgi:hypothetical protein
MEKAGWASNVDQGVIVAALTAVSSGIALQRLKDPNSVPTEMVGQLIIAIYRQFAEPVSDASRALMGGTTATGE